MGAVRCCAPEHSFTEESGLIRGLRAMLESADGFYEPGGDAEQLRRARELLEELL